MIRKVLNYSIGNWRLGLRRIGLWWLVSRYIREQVSYRKVLMNKECKDGGKCVVCGCKVPGLEYGNCGCEGGCFGKIMDRGDWRIEKERLSIK